MGKFCLSYLNVILRFACNLIFPGSISTAEGSALVKLGNTTVVCGVKAVSSHSFSHNLILYSKKRFLRVQRQRLSFSVCLSMVSKATKDSVVVSALSSPLSSIIIIIRDLSILGQGQEEDMIWRPAFSANTQKIDNMDDHSFPLIAVQVAQ